MLRQGDLSVRNRSYDFRVWSILMVILIGVGIIMGMERIPQDSSYHFFVDGETYQGIQNASNVISNIGFVIAGIVGLIRLRKLPYSIIVLMWRFFFYSIVIVGVGSAYYHWQPSNETLFWDRLPMTLGFASLTACVCAERFGLSMGRWLFVPLVTSGACSVIYWLVTERAGIGDLRPYIITQYFPMVIIPMIIILFPKVNKSNKPYWIMLAAYALAKVCELEDGMLFEWTYHMMSGHALKHVVAAVGILLFKPNIQSPFGKGADE